MATGDVRGGSRAARDGDARHDAARCARPRRPVPGCLPAIAPSGDSHDGRDVAAALSLRGGAGVVVVMGGAGKYGKYVSTYCFGLRK